MLNFFSRFKNYVDMRRETGSITLYQNAEDLVDYLIDFRAKQIKELGSE